MVLGATAGRPSLGDVEHLGGTEEQLQRASPNLIIYVLYLTIDPTVCFFCSYDGSRRVRQARMHEDYYIQMCPRFMATTSKTRPPSSFF